jgi:hypothetical protein
MDEKRLVLNVRTLKSAIAAARWGCYPAELERLPAKVKQHNPWPRLLSVL